MVQAVVEGIGGYRNSDGDGRRRVESTMRKRARKERHAVEPGQYKVITRHARLAENAVIWPNSILRKFSELHRIRKASIWTDHQDMSAVEVASAAPVYADPGYYNIIIVSQHYPQCVGCTRVKRKRKSITELS